MWVDFPSRDQCGISRLPVHDSDPDATRRFVANMTEAGFEIVVAANAELAALGVDIITADKTQATILSDNMVGGGIHINAVGGDCPGKTELQADISRRASVFVELPVPTRIESEIQQMPADFPVTPLWQVVAGQHPGRQHREEITLRYEFTVENNATLAAQRCQGPR